MHLVKIACERPDKLGRSLSQWDCRELADNWWPRRGGHDFAGHGAADPGEPPAQAVAASLVAVARGAARRGLRRRVKKSHLYTRQLAPHEMVLCVDEKTSLQPRPRKSPTLPAQPGRPVRVEHEYDRNGALNLFAAFDTRTGKVYGHTAERKRQKEFIEFLEQLDRRFRAHSR